MDELLAAIHPLAWSGPAPLRCSEPGHPAGHACLPLYVITSTWTTEPDVPPHQADAGYWQSLLMQDDPDPDFRTFYHFFATRRPWQRGCIDNLLLEVADDKVANVLITDVRMQRIHHPYDGGADVFLTSPDERDRMRDRHASWLSSHPSGL